MMVTLAIRLIALIVKALYNVSDNEGSDSVIGGGYNGNSSISGGGSCNSNGCRINGGGSDSIWKNCCHWQKIVNANNLLIF